jgi:hypothetical protein
MLSPREEIARLYDKVQRSIVEVHRYQDTAFEFLRDNPFSALFVDTGLGKTVIVLLLIDWLLSTFRARKILIIAPVRVAAQTWPNEIREWDFAAHLSYTVIRAEDNEPAVRDRSGQASLPSGPSRGPRHEGGQGGAGKGADGQEERTEARAPAQPGERPHH